MLTLAASLLLSPYSTQSLTQTTAPGALSAPAYVVQARRLGLPKETLSKLNAPLVPEPTESDKKLAPVVKTGSRIFMLVVWALIALSAAGVVTVGGP